MKSIIFLAVFVSSLAYAGPTEVYLIKSDSSQKIKAQLIGDSQAEGKDLTLGSMDMEILGLCSLKKNCSQNIEFDARFNQVFSKMNGLLEIPENKKFTSGINFPVKYESKVSNDGTDLIKINSSYQMMGMTSSKDYTLKKMGFSINFADSDPKDLRYDFKDASDEKKLLADGVFKIHAVLEDDGLTGESQSHGTGFFISKDGFAMTNLHVMRTNPECLRQKVCKLPISFRTGDREITEVAVEVYSCSSEMDFCLIKIDDSALDIKKSFNINTSEIPKELMTLGFAGDKEEKMSNEEDDENELKTCLTYAEGSAIGLNGLGVSSNLRIFGGASGSPVIDILGSDVFGILSNGLQLQEYKDGMPGLFRPIALIDDSFEISSYLNGSKQKKIETILERILQANDAITARNLIKEYKEEKTYFNLDRIQDLSAEHPSLEVRKVLLQYLKEKSTKI